MGHWDPTKRGCQRNGSANSDQTNMYKADGGIWLIYSWILVNMRFIKVGLHLLTFFGLQLLVIEV